MRGLKDNVTPRHFEQVADPARRPASNLVSTWAQGRRRITPWAYPHLRGLGALRLAIGAFLVVVGALLLSHGYSVWAAIPLVGAALHFSIGGLDMTAGLSAPARS
ncbi:MAG TPA: hypothetical protein VGI58_18350 [Streptosporangiaceae bacterium]|jgi:hypothetical protein